MSNTIIQERGGLVWLQIVRSKSGGEAHTVRCFEQGVTTCDCQGFLWRGKCSHIAAAALQEAHEAQAARPADDGDDEFDRYLSRYEMSQEGGPATRPTIAPAGFRRAASATEALHDLCGEVAA